MAVLATFGRWLGRLFRAQGPGAPPLRAGALASLMGEGDPFTIVSATIADHRAVVTLRDPVPSPFGEIAEQRLLEAAWRAVRAHPGEGPVRSLEVWAPQAPGAPPVRTMRREFAVTLTVPPPLALQAHRPSVPFPATRSRPRPAPSGEPEPADPSLRPLGRFLVVPDGLAERLRARGVDPAVPGLVGLVVGLLEEAGHRVAEREERGRTTDLAVTAAGARSMVRCYGCDGHVRAPTVDQFGFAFLASGADEGFFVTDGLLPFEARHWERDARIHLLDRVGIQRLVDAVALRVAGARAAAPSRG